MRSQLRSVVALFAFTATLCVACQKERMPPPNNQKQITVTSQSKTDNSSSSSSSSDQSQNAPTSGCHHGG